MAINYPTSLDSFSDKVDNVDDAMAVDINDVQDAIEALEAKIGIDSSVVTTSLDYKVNNFFATGRKLWIYENTAPTGWSIVGVSDVAMAVKGGTGLYNVNGGNVAGTSWANLKAHTHTGPSHIHSGTGLSAPNHAHTLATSGTDDPGSAPTNVLAIGGILKISGGSGGADPLPIATTTTGNPSARAVTGSTAAEGTGNTGAQSTADVRPTAAVGIIINKN